MEITAVNVLQILGTLISTAGGIVCAILGRKEESRQRPQAADRWAAGMWICIAIAVINSGILGWRLLQPRPTTDVSITYPVTQATIDQTETVRGTSQELPEGQVIWVVVFAQEVGRYYPQNRPADLEAGNNWSSITYIGVPGDTGKRFDILAVLADVHAQDAFDVYLEGARDRNDWPGLVALPEGAVIYDRVTTIRK